MHQRTQLQRLVATIAGLTLVVAACGSDDSEVDLGVGTPASPSVTFAEAVPSTTTPASGGWIGGEPAWSGGEGELKLAAESGVFEDVVTESLPIEDRPIDGPVETMPLRAGSVDDNADYQGFLDYLDRIQGLGIVTRDLDAAGRTIVSVVDEAGNPVPGAVVEASSSTLTPDGIPIKLRTTADGTVRFHPGFYGGAIDGIVDFGLGMGMSDMERVSAAAGEDITIVAPSATIATPVPLDILFLLDATGSMGDEIDRLKQTIDTVADRVASLDPVPDVRFAMTLYRDVGDAFVTANYDFTSDVEQFRAALADVVADGGGDYPEALDEGLADALAKPAWRDPAEAIQLIFIVADAPPQVGRQVATPYTESVVTAIERGIKIFPVASSESDDQAEAVFRQLAQATGAPFVFLSNGAGGAATGGSTDIASTDYEELALDELVVRLIAEELSALSRSAAGNVTVPTTVTPVQ
ncbi:MAG: VWA domain-containing protein [Actinomycetota bacterium]|nr:VWA domain-containing protein [Actinomycetota bacterium]